MRGCVEIELVRNSGVSFIGPLINPLGYWRLSYALRGRRLLTLSLMSS